MDLKTEEKLVKEAKSSPAAFSKLYDTYYPAIYRYALRRTANVQLSLDITSEVFFQALKHIKKFDWRDIPFSAWLYRIASNKINDSFRRKKYTSVSLDVLFASTDFEPASSENIEQELIDVEENLKKHHEFLKVQKHIASLEMVYQEAITLRYFENKKVKEVALILGKNEGTVKSQLSRGIKKLREKLESIDSKKKGEIPVMQPSVSFRVLPVEVDKNHD